MHKVESIEYRGCFINVYYDEDTECPLQPGDDDAFIWAVWERNSIFSNRKYRPVDEPSEMPAWAEENGYELFPLYKYEHSGVAYNTTGFSYPLDSGQVGYVAVKRDAGFTAELGEVAKSFTSTMSAWCNGECYGYQAVTEDEEDIGSCWGFIGDDRDGYMIDQAKAEIDYHLKEEEELPGRYQDAADEALAHTA